MLKFLEKVFNTITGRTKKAVIVETKIAAKPSSTVKKTVKKAPAKKSTTKKPVDKK
jgi:hypothetical protein